MFIGETPGRCGSVPQGLGFLQIVPVNVVRVPLKKDSVKVSMRATVVLLSKGRCLIAWVGDAEP